MIAAMRSALPVLTLLLASFAVACDGIVVVDPPDPSEEEPALSLPARECDPGAKPSDAAAACEDGDPCTIGRCSPRGCVQSRVGNCR